MMAEPFNNAFPIDNPTPSNQNWVWRDTYGLNGGLIKVSRFEIEPFRRNAVQ